MDIALIIIGAVLCYLIGSINSSIIVGKILKFGDIRKYGSGNAGATNALRVLGKKGAVFTILGDVAKTVLAVLLAKFIAGFIGNGTLCEMSVYISCFMIAIGHNYPVFFKFKGGKGVLTSGVIIIMLSPIFGTITVVSAILVIALTRYVSLGSMTGGVLYPLLTIIFEMDNVMKMVFAIALGGMLILRHSANIKRLAQGKENKLGAKKE